MSLSDPLRAPGKTPTRAEPQQPDKPGRGDHRLPEDDGSASAKESLEKQVEQTNTALDNVRNP